ncbi:MAG: SHOCT domain-containing protein [Streptomyces sp.]|nr:SHOCT domain-containing protein [Streptomyces sp.]
MMWNNGMGSGMGWMWIFWLLVILGTVVVTVVLAKAFTGGRGQHEHVKTGERPRQPREILDERYARGELTTEEYRERLHTLGEGRQ